MILRMVILLFVLSPLFAIGQEVVIDVAYQPNTTYEWSRSIDYDQTVEILGAEDMGDWLQQLGMESYSENQNAQYINVTMTTSDWENRKLYYHASIDSLYKNRISSTPNPSYWHEPQPLETEDLAIHGVINRFHKIEIDSINGVDSLHEKNRVFTLLDDIHRIWTYPSDTLRMGEVLEKTSPYHKSRISSDTSATSIRRSYLLESIENDIAHIRMDYLIFIDKEKTSGELIKERVSEGSGSGRLLYNLKEKQVVLHEYTLDVKSYDEMMDMSMETTSTSTFRWAMNIDSKD